MRVETGLIREYESDYVVSFKVYRAKKGEWSTNGLERSQGGRRVTRVTGVTRHAESNDDVSFKVQTRTSGLKKRRLVHQLPRAKREAKKKSQVYQLPRAKQEAM